MGIINRRKLGKTRHIDTGHLWIQEIAAKERLKFKKVLGKDNPADLYTKYLDEKTNKHHVENLAFKFAGGRAEEAPQLHAVSHSRAEYEEGNNFKHCEWVNIITDTLGNAWRGEKKFREELQRIEFKVCQVTTSKAHIKDREMCRQEKAVKETVKDQMTEV